MAKSRASIAVSATSAAAATTTLRALCDGAACSVPVPLFCTVPVWLATWLHCDDPNKQLVDPWRGLLPHAGTALQTAVCLTKRVPVNLIAAAIYLPTDK